MNIDKHLIWAFVSVTMSIVLAILAGNLFMGPCSGIGATGAQLLKTEACIEAAKNGKLR